MTFYMDRRGTTKMGTPAPLFYFPKRTRISLSKDFFSSQHHCKFLSKCPRVCVRLVLIRDSRDTGCSFPAGHLTDLYQRQARWTCGHCPFLFSLVMMPPWLPGARVPKERCFADNLKQGTTTRPFPTNWLTESRWAVQAGWREGRGCEGGEVGWAQ